jgi:hypothetical protein
MRAFAERLESAVIDFSAELHVVPLGRHRRASRYVRVHRYKNTYAHTYTRTRTHGGFNSKRVVDGG